MKCPKCNNPMPEVTQDTVTFNKCSGCHGLWFQDESLAAAMKTKGIANKIDDEQTNSALAYNATRDINCPECTKKMIKMTDMGQLHIQYECCHYCNGVFFDSGEFKDAASFSLAERVKQTIETLKRNMGA